MTKQITSKTQTVTPAMCTKWLESNESNRPLSQPHINYLARIMIQNDWDLNGESLKFDIDGGVLDGQHRMWACIEADKSFKTIIITNLPRAVFDTIDTGRVRGAPDVLSMNGEINTVLLSGILKHIGRYHSGHMLSTGRISNKEIEDMLATYPNARDITAMLSRKQYRVPWCAASIIGTCWYLAQELNKTEANTFFYGMIFGAELTKDSPILTLRNKLITVHTTKGHKLSTPEKMEMVVIAWNAFRKGKTLNRFILTTLSKESREFPQLK